MMTSYWLYSMLASAHDRKIPDLGIFAAIAADNASKTSWMDADAAMSEGSSENVKLQRVYSDEQEQSKC
jgi:hypothetical protein